MQFSPSSLSLGTKPSCPSALPGLTVRLARPEELDAIWTLCQAVRAQLDAEGTPIWDDAYPTPDIFAEDLAHGALWAALLDGAVVATASCNSDFAGEYFFDCGPAEAALQTRALFAYSGAPENATVSIHRLMVAPDARRRGIAAALLRSVEQQLSSLWIVLFAASINVHARRLYEKLGYADLGEYRFSFGSMRYLVKAPQHAPAALKARQRLTPCGDNCLACPRFWAETPEELSYVAELWRRAGWRSAAVSPETLRCQGCSTHSLCSYGLRPCLTAHKLSGCRECPESPCRLHSFLFERSEASRQKCQSVCSASEYALLERAFFQKQSTLAL